MLIYRVFPYLRSAKPNTPGHPSYIHPQQGASRWDNPGSYRALYTAATPTAAISETFANITRWTPAMLPFPLIPGSERRLGVYLVDEEVHPLLDLDNAQALLDRNLRPSEIVIRNRPRTQRIANDIFAEKRWSGISWWSMHRPQWALHCWWDNDSITLQHVDEIPGHPATADAATRLARERSDL